MSTKGPNSRSPLKLHPLNRSKCIEAKIAEITQENQKSEEQEEQRTPNR